MKKAKEEGPVFNVEKLDEEFEQFRRAQIVQSANALAGVFDKYIHDLKLDVCKRRREWKMADISKVEALGITKGQYWIKKILREEPVDRRGRGNMSQPKHLIDVFLQTNFVRRSPELSAGERRKAIQELLPGPWAELVEAAYRGEKEAEEVIRAEAIAGVSKNERSLYYLGEPSTNAERNVAAAIDISQSRVGQFCTAARVGYRKGRAPLPPMRAADLERFLETGNPPKSAS